MFKKNLKRTLMFLSLITFTSVTHAGGITLGATRVIYPSEAKQVSVSLRNTDKNSDFLVQSWIENGKGQKTDNIVITPPLFVMKSEKENTLRLILSEKNLPKDKESIYWLNVKAIPPQLKEGEGANTLQIAVVSRIKIFIRPELRGWDSNEAHNKLEIKKSGNKIIINNPTPFYMTLVNFNINNKKQESLMISPKSDKEIIVNGSSPKNVTYQTINDFGALTDKKNISF